MVAILAALMMVGARVLMLWPTVAFLPVPGVMVARLEGVTLMVLLKSRLGRVLPKLLVMVRVIGVGSALVPPFIRLTWMNAALLRRVARLVLSVKIGPLGAPEQQRVILPELRVLALVQIASVLVGAVSVLVMFSVRAAVGPLGAKRRLKTRMLLLSAAEGAFLRYESIVLILHRRILEL